MNSNTIKDILQCGSHDWNEWRWKNPQVKPDLSGLKLSGYDLSFYNFSNSIFFHTTWIDTNLANCNFTESRVYKVHFMDCKMTHANLSGSVIFNTFFDNGNYRNINLTEVRLKECDFFRTDLQHACFHRSISSQCMFLDAVMDHTDFSHSVLYQPKFNVHSFSNVTTNWTIINKNKVPINTF